jgi:DNA gyrase/topoisomerase IV subunit A
MRAVERIALDAVEALAVFDNNRQEMFELIQSSVNVEQAYQALMTRVWNAYAICEMYKALDIVPRQPVEQFGGLGADGPHPDGRYRLTSIQAYQILSMPMRYLVGSENDKRIYRHRELFNVWVNAGAPYES